MEMFELDREVHQERLPSECSLNSPLNLSLSLQLFGRLAPKTEHIRYQAGRIKRWLARQYQLVHLRELEIDSTRIQGYLIPHLLKTQSNELGSSVMKNWGMVSKYYLSLGYTLPPKDKFEFRELLPYWNLASQLREVTLESQKVDARGKEKRKLYQVEDVEFEFKEGVVGDSRGSGWTPELISLGGQSLGAVTYVEYLALFKIINQRAQALLLTAICQGILSIYAESTPCSVGRDNPLLTCSNCGNLLFLQNWGTCSATDSALRTLPQIQLGEANKFQRNYMFTRSYKRMMRTLVQETRAQALFQYFGLFKHSPASIRHKTSKAIPRSLLNKPSDSSPLHYLSDQCQIREILTSDNTKAYHRAPAMNLVQLGQGSYLRQVLEAGKIPNTKNALYSLLEWFFVRFEKSIEWPLSDTLSTFLSDKAITQNRDIWYDGGSSGRDTTEKRLLLKFIKENEDSVEKVILKADEIYDKKADQIIALKVKAMELKIKGRGFDLMAFRPRLLQVLRESIAKKTSKLFPEITMTFSDLELKKKKFQLSRKSDDRRGYIHISKSLDISKFCTSQRQFNSLAVFQNLDELLGTDQLFTRVHEIFEKTWIVDGSASDPPDLVTFKARYEEALALGIEAPHVWADGAFSGLMGGIEGLCQYVWTICLLLRVERVLAVTQLTHFVMAQGDNVIINLIIPVEVDRVGGVVEGERATIQHISKDILTSENLSIYGKDLHCPQHLTLAVKKAGSASIISSEQYQDVPTFLSGLGTGMETISECVNNKVSAHLFGVILGAAGWKSLAQRQTWKGWEYPFQNEATRRQVRSQGILLQKGESTMVHKEPEVNPEKRTIELLLVSSLFGSALGMLPFPTPIDLEKRSVGDYVTHRLSIIKMALVSKKLPNRMVEMIVFPHEPFSFPENGISRNYSIPPFSLNLGTEEDAASVIKRLARGTLRGLDIKNKKLADHIATMDQGITQIDDALASADTINPRIAYQFRNITDQKESEMFVTKFATAKTMRMVVFSSSQDVSVVGFLNKRSQAKEIYTIWRTQRKGETLWTCSTQQAKKLRDLSWGKNIIGVTSPSPLEATRFKLIDPISWEEEKEAHHFTIHYYLSKPSLSSKTAHTTRGPLVPYFGTQTKPLIAKAYMELKGNPRTNKALQLLSMRETMIKAGSNLDKLLLSLCSNALNIDVNSLPSLQAQKEAIAGEGVRRGIKKSMFPVGPKNLYTHITHKVFLTPWLSEFMFGDADFIIWGITKTRQHLQVDTDLGGSLPICVPACPECYREKERVFLDIPKEMEWVNTSTTSDKAQTYFSTWCDLPRVSTLPSLDQKDATCLMGRSMATQKSTPGESITKMATQKSTPGESFYSTAPDTHRLLHPVTLVLGYAEGTIFSYMKSQHNIHGSLYHPHIDQIEPALEKYVIDTKTSHTKHLGYLFQDADSLQELLETGITPYIPRSIPLTITELTSACCMNTCQKQFHCPQNWSDHSIDARKWIGRKTISKWQDSPLTPFLDSCPRGRIQLVYLDCDLTSQMTAWVPTSQRSVLGSVNFHIEGIAIPLTATEMRVGQESWEERKWTCSNNRHIIAKGVKTKSLFIHQSVPEIITHPPDLIVVIGGGLGGCVVPYLQKWRDPKVIFCTLFDERERISEDGDLIIPPGAPGSRTCWENGPRKNSWRPKCVTSRSGGNRELPHQSCAEMGSAERNFSFLIDEIENRGDQESVLQSSISELSGKNGQRVPNLTSVHTIRETGPRQFAQRVNTIRRGRKTATLHWNQYNRRDQMEALLLIESHTRKTELHVTSSVVQAAFRKIDEKLESESRLEHSKWSLPELPPREKDILLGYVASVFLKLGLVVTDRHMSAAALITLLEEAGPKMISWDKKMEHRTWASSDAITEKGVTQDQIFSLLCFAWALRGLKSGDWEHNADAIILQDVHIDTGPRLCQMGESPKRTFASFRLHNTKKAEDLKGYLGALLHLESFFPFGEQ
uniref:Replicase n=1 Tax=Viral hemorrhagic septicemia virus (strain 07-71) TaxID=11288 RepID=Q9WA89_VHSV0|nr:RNA-dependent RNA polymerase [Viral hemorrhagic septicemia virus 07-71]